MKSVSGYDLHFRWPWMVTTSEGWTSNGCALWLALWSRSLCCSLPPLLRIYATAAPGSPWRILPARLRRPTPTNSSWTCHRLQFQDLEVPNSLKSVLTANEPDEFEFSELDRNSTPWLGRVEVRWAVVRSSASPSLGLWSGIHGSCCWTWQHLPLTTRAKL